jgi:hypothetical protein
MYLSALILPWTESTRYITAHYVMTPLCSPHLVFMINPIPFVDESLFAVQTKSAIGLYIYTVYI